MPRLAQAFPVDEAGWLFVSRIAWVPSDELTLRPWMREHLEGPGLDVTSYQMAMEDDDALERMLDRHDAWEQGIQPTGPRWLASQAPHFVVALIEPEFLHQALGLWIRCKEHLDHAEQLTAAEILTAARHKRP